jgi:predicted dehydrogenase
VDGFITIRLQTVEGGQTKMKGLVIGGGSIGKRHLANLTTLGVQHLALVEMDPARREAVAGELSVRSFPDVEAGLEWQPDFVVIATPTHLHLEQSSRVVRGDFHLFVEKPLSHSGAGLSELSDLVESKKLVSMVGCNMRFHPGPARVKQLLSEDRIGRILFARLHTGSYLPRWRPSTDYRKNYAAHEETGGGCILDWIHEIDLTRWYLGKVREVVCMAGHLSSLEITTEDVAAIICRHGSGAISEIHLDYVQQTYERGCQIVGEQGSIFWDFTQKLVRWFDAASGKWNTFSEPDGWELNQMYVDEMKHFIDCVASGSPTALPIPEATAVMQIALAAKTSARDGRVVPTTSEVLA